jgi:ABC-type cobalamin/Fe3+-siderophores transport system ATPase subunit
MSEPRLKVTGASFRFGEHPVWSGINLEVKEGEAVCLLGPNGCGKTTLLNCIHGDLKLETGQVRLDGAYLEKLNTVDIARRVGYVFQEHNSPFPYSSLEVIRMGRAPHLGIFQSPSASDTALAETIMEEMGILHLRDQRYTQISGGERQLVLIARTLCQEPRVILFDEPTSHLDFKNQALVLRTIRRLSERGMTIIMTSHFPNHAWMFSSRVIMMNQGKFVAEGPAREVMTEENLTATYGIPTRVYHAGEGADRISFCTPEF